MYSKLPYLILFYEIEDVGSFNFWESY